MNEQVYKIVLEEYGRLKTLFKAIEGSRHLPVNVWLKAEKKMGRDGSNQEPYLTGIHCFKDENIAKKYLSHFRTEKNRIIVRCIGMGLREKPSNKDVFLADEILIEKT